jgi:hypothetical protein
MGLGVMMFGFIEERHPFPTKYAASSHLQSSATVDHGRRTAILVPEFQIRDRWMSGASSRRLATGVNKKYEMTPIPT